MKYSVVFLAFVALVAAEEEWKPIRTMEPYQLIHSDCAKESGVTPEQTVKIAAFEYPDEEEVHKYVLCGASRMSVFNGEGFSLDRVAQSFNVPVTESEKIKKILIECIENNTENSTLQVWAYRGFQCMLKSEVGVALKKAIEANRQIRANAAASEAKTAAAESAKSD